MICLRPSVAASLLAFVISGLGRPGDALPSQDKKKGAAMDYGPFLSASYIHRAGAKFDNGSGNFDAEVTARGIAVKLSEHWEAGAIFDTDSMRWSAGWVGGPLKFTGVIFDGAHGPSPTLGVPPLFEAPRGPGWAKDGSFADPRPDSIAPLPRPGPLPAEWAKYRGLYLHGGRVVLSYTVGKASVLESVSLEGNCIARTVNVEGADSPMELRVAVAPAKGAAVEGAGVIAGGLHITGLGLPAGAAWAVKDGEVRLALPATGFQSFKILMSESTGAVKDSPKPEDLRSLTKPGPPRWPDLVETKGVVSPDPGPYVVDVLTLPVSNPWKAKMRVGGFDFFPDGASAALCTWDGDVWVVKGIDEKLESLSWKRFATGLYQPLGLKVVDGAVYVVGHDQITRLHDLNGDGEADFYENFNNDWELTTAFHSFCFDLHTDSEGNFYFAFNSPVRSGGGGFHRITNHQGCILRVSKDGRKLDVYATGFRANNGIGVGPNGEVTSGDNEGTWVPKCPLHWVKPGSFNGVVDAAHRELKSSKGKPDAADQPKPLCWMPKNVDNSGGGQVWVTSGRWGPFKGDLLHTSYGTSSLYKVLMEEIDGQKQGGVVRFPVRFTSSAMRSRFNPRDGQLYVAGLKGWQSNAARDGGLDRVRYTGAPVHMPASLRAGARGLEIGFTLPLDPESAKNVENYAVEVWNYRWTSNYGSGEYSTLEGQAPPAKGEKRKEKDALTVASAALSQDGKTVTLQVEGMKPVMQMRIVFKLRAADGKTPVNHEIYNTIHALGP